MDIFEFAIEKEKTAKQYYLELQQKTSNTGLKNIFQMLAEQEQQHVHAIEKLKAQDKHELAESPVLSDAKKIFVKMRDAKETFDFGVSELELYQKARDIEKKAMEFYLEKAEEVDVDWQKDVFVKLAAEEKKHFTLLDNICDFVSQPETWLENAEFFHKDNF